MKKKVFVGLSGGVDSSVTAHLLLEQGYDVTGVFMKNWPRAQGVSDEDCPRYQDYLSAKSVAEKLGIEFKVYNFEKEYAQLVITDFYDEYRAGRTPNPDVLCNKYIKFDAFLEKALEDGADFVAMGHYSRTKNGELLKAEDINKDQTYFLHQLTKEQLEKTLFPLGDLIKPEVRTIAKKAGLSTADKKDSQGICFVGKVNMNEFLKEVIDEKEGQFVDIDTRKVVGKHSGVPFYTIGQRKGIKIGGSGEPYFVAEKDLATNTIYLAKGKRHASLWKSEMFVQNMHTIDGEEIKDGEYTASVRYRAADKKMQLTQKDNGYQIIFSEPVWAPATGQSLVIFDGNRCLGGGKISEIVD